MGYEDISLVALPDHVKIYAEYKDEDGTPAYERIHLVGLMKNEDGSTFYSLLSLCDGIIERPEKAKNFVCYHISENWIKELPSDFIENKED